MPNLVTSFQLRIARRTVRRAAFDRRGNLVLDSVTSVTAGSGFERRGRGRGSDAVPVGTLSRIGRKAAAALALALAAALGGGAAQAAPEPWGAIGAAEPLTGLGTEPFWGVRIHRGFLKLTTPDDEAGRFARIRRAATRRTLTFRGTLRREGPFTVTVRRDPRCSDGMSDRTYPFELTIRFARHTLQGCGWTARRPYSKLEDG